MNRAFENDPRLKRMNPDKIAALQSLARELEAASGDRKMAALLSAGQKAVREHIFFSAEEQELLIQILMENMSSEERKKAEAVRKLAGRIQKNSLGA